MMGLDDELHHAGPPDGWRARFYHVIFEAETRAGMIFDVALLFVILASIIVVMLETVADIQVRNERLFLVLEWAVTVLFTIEYGLRLACVRRPLAYAVSFFGIVDLLAILPTPVALLTLNAGAVRSLIVIRALRLLRIFRVFKMGRFTKESRVLLQALAQSRTKIVVFLAAVLVIVVIMGALLYLVETGVNEGFSSLPQSMYWVIVTMTTVGYGDVVPVTAEGKLIASLIMMLGFSLIVVPTGILSAELAASSRSKYSQCPSCGDAAQAVGARFCRLCGGSLS